MTTSAAAPTATYPPSYTAESFAAPPLECDMVMKGGITSGVVYPYAITELARKYRFKNIGGTSAGAIAASLAAAAEYGRASEDGGFLRLAQLPGVMAKNLSSLFQPTPRARPAFAVALALLGDGGPVRKGFRILRAILFGHPLWALLGGLLGGLVYLALVVLVAGSAGLAQLLEGEAAVGSLVLSGVFVLLGGTLGASRRFVKVAGQALETNDFGLCSGFWQPSQRRGTKPPLIEWLTDELDRTAGKPVGKVPLTFGDLWGDEPDAAGDPRLRRINLEMMTSSLVHGQPYRLPFEERTFHWRPADLASLFPAHVVEYMIRCSKAIEGVPGLYALPEPKDLPVVFGVRMSLSFPFLFSAVPLYALDWGRLSNQEAKKENKPPRYERCLFSDGGLGSNFPVHFFDALLPSRPTFGINLRGYAAEREPSTAECDNVRFPSRPGSEVRPEWRRFEGSFGFAGSLIRLMQNWVDTTQARLPGYRDRVVHVHLTDEEGGLNLTMPEDRVLRLSERGWCAGRTIVDSFNWDQHRWARYRSTMPALHHQLTEIAARFRGIGGGETFFGFLERYGPVPDHYKLDGEKIARERANALIELIEVWPPGLFRKPRVPAPEPLLRMTPRI